MQAQIQKKQDKKQKELTKHKKQQNNKKYIVKTSEQKSKTSKELSKRKNKSDKTSKVALHTRQQKSPKFAICKQWELAKLHKLWKTPQKLTAPKQNNATASETQKNSAKEREQTKKRV